MNIFLDTEFTALRQSGRLISLALVADDDRWFYAEFTDYDPADLSDWHREYVLPYLFLEKGEKPDFAVGNGGMLRGDARSVGLAVKEWLEEMGAVSIWADVLAYDWVLFCELFGGALHLPDNVFYMPFDFSTLLKVRGMYPDTPRDKLAPEWAASYSKLKHNALYDAFLLRAAYQKLGEQKQD